MTNDMNMKEKKEFLDGPAECEGGEEDVDLYDDVLSLSVEKHDIDDHEDLTVSRSPDSNQGVNNISRVQTDGNHIHNDSRGERDHPDVYKDAVMPHRRHQVCVGNLTWWTSDNDIQEVMAEVGVHDFIDVKFYDNRANGQSKGYCVVTVGSDASLKIIHEKLSKKDIHGQFPVVTHPTKQNLNQFEAQSKNRPSPSAGQGMGNGGGRGFDGPGNGNMGGMNTISGPRGPMPMAGSHGMGMGMGYCGGPGQRMMGGPPGHGPGPMHGNRGMPPMGQGGPRMPMMMHGGPPGPMGRGPLTPGESPGMMGPQHHGGQPGYGPPLPQRQMAPQNSMPMQPMLAGPRMPVMMHGGPLGPGPMPMGRGPMQPAMMDPRGPPPRQEWERPPMNNYPPHGPGQIPMPMNRPPDIRGQVPPIQIPVGGSGQLQRNPAPHMNPAFFGSQPGPGPGLTGVGSFNSPEPQLAYHPPAMSEVEFDEIMSRNKTVSSSAISRAVSDAATGEFASAIETLVTAISLIKQSKVAHDDRCKILVSSLQDTQDGIEAKSYGSTRRERSRSRDRHRRIRRDRTRSRENYRDRSRDRYYGEYIRERSRSRDREYRERPREETARPYYDERYRERDRERERERVPVRPESARSRERDRERESEREPAHRAPRH